MNRWFAERIWGEYVIHGGEQSKSWTRIVQTREVVGRGPHAHLVGESREMRAAFDHTPHASYQVAPGRGMKRAKQETKRNLEDLERKRPEKKPWWFVEMTSVGIVKRTCSALQLYKI